MSNKKKVLVVDDEENIIISVQYLLEKEGYEVLSAKNGAEAVSKFLEFSPDVVLLDVMMPVMDGITTATKIRNHDSFSKTRIVFLTAKGTSPDKQLGYISGGDDYIVKPFDNEELLEIVAEKAL